MINKTFSEHVNKYRRKKTKRQTCSRYVWWSLDWKCLLTTCCGWLGEETTTLLQRVRARKKSVMYSSSRLDGEPDEASKLGSSEGHSQLSFLTSSGSGTTSLAWTEQHEQCEVINQLFPEGKLAQLVYSVNEKFSLWEQKIIIFFIQSGLQGFRVRIPLSAYVNVLTKRTESDHTAAEGTGSGLGLIAQLFLILLLCSECVQGHWASVAAEGATAQRFTATARPQGQRVSGQFTFLRLVHLQPAGWDTHSTYFTYRTQFWSDF